MNWMMKKEREGDGDRSDRVVEEEEVMVEVSITRAVFQKPKTYSINLFWRKLNSVPR